VSISPGDGSASVPPDSRIVVKTDDGTLTRVTARSRGQDVPGDLNTDRTSWQARWTLTPGAAYQVTATAITRSGAVATATSTFRAAVVHGGLTAWVAPSEGATVGVGMPVTVTFNHPVTDQAAVERTLQIHSDKPVTGAWHWTDQATVMFRTQNGHYWPADQNITVTAHLAGVRSGPGTYGTADTGRTFHIGDQHLITVSATTHQLVARSNGRVVNRWGVSLGSGHNKEGAAVSDLLTTSGIHLTMDKENPAHMVAPGLKPTDLDYYDEQVPWATRITNSGEYIHQTMGEEACLGVRNCSHGCVRSPGDKAKWFYHWSYIGDVVTISGTGRTLQPTDGWGASYQMPWPQWLKGSALGTEVSTR
jgi:lipoprotein-anchoring transpeptidase ErfK/SrfK